MVTRIKYEIAGLVQGGRPTCSMGRVAFWLVFSLSVYFWIALPIEAFPATLEQTLMLLLAYNLGGKLMGRPKPHQPGLSPGPTEKQSLPSALPELPMGKAVLDNDSLDKI